MFGLKRGEICEVSEGLNREKWGRDDVQRSVVLVLLLGLLGERGRGTRKKRGIHDTVEREVRGDMTKGEILLFSKIGRAHV